MRLKWIIIGVLIASLMGTVAHSHSDHHNHSDGGCMICAQYTHMSSPMPFDSRIFGGWASESTYVSSTRISSVEYASSVLSRAPPV